MQCPPKQVPLVPGGCTSSNICDVAYGDRWDFMNAVHLGVANENFHPENDSAATRLAQYPGNIAAWCFAAAENAEAAYNVTGPGNKTRTVKEAIDPPSLLEFAELGTAGALIGVYFIIFGSLYYFGLRSIRYHKRGQPNSHNTGLFHLIHTLDLVALIGVGVSGWFVGTLKDWGASRIICTAVFGVCCLSPFALRQIVFLTGRSSYNVSEFSLPGMLSDAQLEKAKRIGAHSDKLLQLYVADKPPSQLSDQERKELRLIARLRELSDKLQTPPKL